MTQNLNGNGVIKTPNRSCEQFQPTNINETNPWELGLQAGELIAKHHKESGDQLAAYFKECGERSTAYYEKLVILCSNSQNSQLFSPACCSQKQKEQIEMEQWIKKSNQT